MRNYNILILQEGKFFVAKNVDLGVVSQGESIEEAVSNIREATELYLEEEKSYKNPYSQSFLTTISV
ncbi:MAG: type II toxin-antitoxin system HicB family antitoxin [Candidatus Gracilibacteria bacterium]|nr:type II toxin-antitoxin system HicB family antitoxin [Candidatus Gracilibacteria bacterium]